MTFLSVVRKVLVCAAFMEVEQPIAFKFNLPPDPNQAGMPPPHIRGPLWGSRERRPKPVYLPAPDAGS